MVANAWSVIAFWRTVHFFRSAAVHLPFPKLNPCGSDARWSDTALGAPLVHAGHSQYESTGTRLLRSAMMQDVSPHENVGRGYSGLDIRARLFFPPHAYTAVARSLGAKHAGHMFERGPADNRGIGGMRTNCC